MPLRGAECCEEEEITGNTEFFETVKSLDRNKGRKESESSFMDFSEGEESEGDNLGSNGNRNISSGFFMDVFGTGC